MLYLVSYENAHPVQDQRIREILAGLNGKNLLGRIWIVDIPNKNLLDMLWMVRLGENLQILVADVSHSHFATVPYSDVRALVRAPAKPSEDKSSD